MSDDQAGNGAADEPGWLNRQQGFFTEEVVTTLAAAAGLSISTPKIDLGFDLNLDSPTGEIARLQVKSTRTPLAVVGDDLRYNLEVEAYNRLRHDFSFPTFLVVVQVPDQRIDWASCGADEITMRHRAHYTSLRDQPATANAATVTVSLPLVNMVTPTVLRAMVEGGLQ